MAARSPFETERHHNKSRTPNKVGPQSYWQFQSTSVYFELATFLTNSLKLLIKPFC
jgi:hypothetical protein